MKLELLIPDALVKDGRLERYAYLAASVTALLLVRRAKDSTIPRENAIGVFAALVPTELSHKLMALNVLAVFYAIKHRLPLLHSWSGSMGVVLHGIVLAKLVNMYKSNLAARHAIVRAMKRYSDIAPATLERIGEMSLKRWLSVMLPLPQPMALALSFPGVSKIRTKTYAHVGRLKTTKLKMDVYKHRNAKPNAPIFLYIHGGGWVIGNRRLPPLPLVYQVASLGWVVCSIDYRLSPMVAFPSHLIDAKRAVAYLREHAREQFDADPNFIVVAGESAGGHLASLVALTAGDKSLQPGFEHIDTSVRGCVDSYGVHDFMDRSGIYRHRDGGENFVKYLELLVMQKKLHEHKDAFEAASPVSWLDASATGASRSDVVPPFLVTHGTWDTLVPFQDSALFFEQLVAHRARTNGRTIAGVKDVFLRIDEAHHMFNYLASPRTLAHGDAVCAFLDNLHRKTKDLPLAARFFKWEPEQEPRGHDAVEDAPISALAVSKL